MGTAACRASRPALSLALYSAKTASTARASGQAEAAATFQGATSKANNKNDAEQRRQQDTMAAAAVAQTLVALSALQPPLRQRIVSWPTGAGDENEDESKNDCNELLPQKFAPHPLFVPLGGYYKVAGRCHSDTKPDGEAASDNECLWSRTFKAERFAQSGEKDDQRDGTQRAGTGPPMLVVEVGDDTKPGTMLSCGEVMLPPVNDGEAMLSPQSLLHA